MIFRKPKSSEQKGRPPLNSKNDLMSPDGLEHEDEGRGDGSALQGKIGSSEQTINPAILPEANECEHERSNKNCGDAVNVMGRKRLITDSVGIEVLGDASTQSCTW